jgi:hypothetical protein
MLQAEGSRVPFSTDLILPAAWPRDGLSLTGTSTRELHGEYRPAGM